MLLFDRADDDVSRPLSVSLHMEWIYQETTYRRHTNEWKTRGISTQWQIVTQSLI